MRILHIVDSYEPASTRGGVAAAATIMVRGQARAGGDVTVFTTAPALERHEVGDVETRGGAEVHYFRTRLGSRRFLPWPLLAACLKRMREFDIIHIHGLWRFPSAWGALFARLADVPYVLTPHGMLNVEAIRFGAYKKFPYWYLVESRTVRRAAWLHFTSEEERLQAHAWVRGKRESVIPIGLDLREFDVLPPRGGFRWRQGISIEVPMLAFLGRIHPIKALDVLLRALIRVNEEIPEITLVIAGPDVDGHGTRLRRLAQTLGVDGQLRWVGPVDGYAKLQLLVDTDLFLLPSYSENFGLAAVEAMAVGRPAILGRGVNIAADVEAWNAGWLADSEPQALAAVILRALRDPGGLKARGEAGRRLVSAKYDADTAACHMMKLYEDCLR